MRLNKVSELIHNSSDHQNLDSAAVSVHFQEIVDLADGTNEAVEGSDFVVLNEKRSASVNMVKLAEKERESLENVKNEAEEYMLKELSLLKWQEKATKLSSDDAATRVILLQEDVSNLETNLTSEREKIQQNSSTLKELESVYNKYVKRQEELDTEMRTCKDQFKEFERQDVKYREDLKHLKQKIKKLDDKVEKAPMTSFSSMFFLQDASKLDESMKDIDESSNLIPKLEGEIPKLQQLLLAEEKLLEEIKESSRDETERHHLELIKVRAELEPWENQLIEHKGKLDVASAESKLLKEKHIACQVEFEQAQQENNDIVEKIKTKKASITEIQAKIERNRLGAMEAHKIEEESLKKEESLIPLEQAARQKLSEIMSVLETEKTQGAVLKAILQAKESKDIEGIFGRLGDLGAIEAKYDVAISTACPGLDYIVVETTAAAQACVELLRRKNLGVATFMIMEKQVDHLHKLNKKVQTPENVPRLFDLVTVKDERLKLAFFAVLGNTVVAEDLNQATRIAYGGDKEFRRVVTLEGALFEKSGTMSGGGTKPRGGKMGTSIRESVSGEVILNAEKELAELVDQLSILRQRITDARSCYQAAEGEIAHLEMELAKSWKEIDSLNAQYSYNEKRLGSLKTASQPKEDDLCRLEELDHIILAEQRELDKLAKCSSKLKDRAFELQNKIENAGGEVLKNQKSKVTNIQSEIDKTSTEINRHKVKIATCEKFVKKLTKGIEESKKEKEKNMEEKEKMMSVFKEIEQKAFLVQENYKKTQELIDKHKDVLDETKAKYNKLKKMMEELRAAEVDAEYKLQDAKKLAKEWEMKTKALKKRVDDIQLNLVKHMDQIQMDAVDPEKLQATVSEESLNDACDMKRAMEMVALLEAQIKEMNPNLDSIAEYRKKVLLYNARVDELNSVTQERDDLKKLYDGLRKKRLDEFMTGFNIISLKLKEMYQMITLGGDAELELVDSLDPFSEGVVFSVRPPKKSWKNIANLSGGEKACSRTSWILFLCFDYFTLSSLALVFALHHYKPTPLYVMDEIDAALDFKNVSIVGHYVKDRTRDAQFIIISLRNNMFELADRLVGIYKTHNCTKSITVNPGSFVDCGKAA
ncbi:Structural maintenance of chromosomes protein 4 [Ananas comosus]|uniref:Structural maintenance of chromosomes protein 4 n=1 Tax=Ananas comosus TaxID=4615 RepID=A0A199W2V1_ANACO|nr:Structural maintenance of chromosomes protein 4 [Ananas comosus]